MTHRDAPPETSTQTACREFWQSVQPHVQRAWGRAKNGSFLAEESRLLHEAWVKATIAEREACAQACIDQGNGKPENPEYGSWGEHQDCADLINSRRG